MNPSVLHPNNRPVPVRRLAVLFVFALALHLCGTWIMPLIDRDEPRFSEASREMRERSDWILPTFNNLPRYDKPPLTYWCQIACYTMFGENDLAARFHSALFTALTALVVCGFCSRLYGPGAGWRAAMAFTICVQVMVQAKAAVADMPMVFFVALGTWAGWELLSNEQAPSRKWWWIFYGSLALGFLAKGPIAWLPIGTVLIHARWQRAGGLNRALKFQYGLPLMLAIVALWGVPALVKTHGEFFNVGIGKHVVERSFSPMEGHGSKGALTYFVMLPFYFLTYFASFFPWSIFTWPVYLRLRKQCAPADRYLIGGALLTFVIFTLVKTKLPHYTLPAFPLLACLVAPELENLRASLFRGLSGAMVAFNLAVAFIVFPIAESHILLPVKRMSASLPLPPQMEFASVDYDEPSEIWYFRRQLKTWHEYLAAGDLPAYMSQPGPRLCVAPAELADKLPPGPWERHDFEGRDIANGKSYKLALLVKTAGGQ